MTLSSEGELSRWKTLSTFAVELANCANLNEKIKLILKTLSAHVQGEGKLWLTPQFLIFYEKEVIENIIPVPTPLIQAAFSSHQIEIEKAAQRLPMRMAYPLTAQDDFMGVLQVERPSQKPFSPEDCDYLQAFASQASVSIQMSHQVQIDNWRFDQLALVRSVTFQIANVLDVDELTRRITRLILHTFNYYYVAIFTLEPGQDSLQFRANSRMGADQNNPDDASPGISVHLGEGIVGYVAEKGEEFISGNVHHEPSFRYVESLPETQSEMAIPLKVENEILGVLDVQSNQLNSFDSADMLVLRALADSIAVAIEQARTYSVAQKRAEQINTVVEVSRAITSILDLDVLLGEIVTLIHKRFGYPFVHLFMVDQERQSITFRAGGGARSDSMQKFEISYDLDDPNGIIPYVARSGQPVLANDVTHNPHYRPSFLNPTETKAEMTLPLIFNKEVLGVLDLQSDCCDVFTLDDISLLEALSANVAISIRNASLYHSETWRRQAAESLRDITGNISRQMDINELLQIILAEVQRNIPCDITGIWLADETKGKSKEAESFHLAAIRGIFNEGSEIHKKITSQDDAWLSRFLKFRDIWVRVEADPMGPLGKLLEYPPEYSAITVPLQSNGHLIGFLDLANQVEDIYGSDAREMMSFFAGYVSIIIENSHLLSEAQIQARISTSLLQISQETQTLTALPDLANVILQHISLLIGVKGCAFYTWNEGIAAFEQVNSQGIPFKSQESPEGQVIPVDRFPTFGRLAINKEKIFVPQVEIDELLLPPPDEKKEPDLFMLIPLVARSELLGTLLISFLPFNAESVTALAIEEEQLSVITGISQQTAIAMDNIRLLEASQEEAYANAVLLQIAQAIVGADDITDTLEAVVHVLPILIGIDSSLIYVWDETQQLLKPGHLHLKSQEAEEALYAQAFKPGEAALIDQLWQADSPKLIAYENEDIFPLKWLTEPNSIHDLKEAHLIELERQAHILLSFPIAIKDRKFGLFLIEEADYQSYLDDKRMDILLGIVQQVSLAFQNDYLQKQMVYRERFEREIQLAHEIQKTFLPTGLPNYQGWDFDIRWQPAYQVGGDFYDYFDLPHNHLGLVIADVSDKGLPAALYMTVARTLIRATTPKTSSPARMLEQVNDMLLLNSHEGLFITAFYGILDLATGDLTYASAGHNLPLLWHKSKKTINALEAGGAALGITGEAIHLPEFHIQLKPDEFLILYTDGVTETFSPQGDLYGDERLKATISGSQVDCASQLTDDIIASVNDFSQSQSPGDDVTIFAIHRLS